MNIHVEEKGALTILYMHMHSLFASCGTHSSGVSSQFPSLELFLVKIANFPWTIRPNRMDQSRPIYISQTLWTTPGDPVYTGQAPQAS